MTVGVLEVERAIEAIVLVEPLPNLREVELNPIREVDADAMLSPRRRASDRTGGVGAQRVGNHDACFSALDIYVKFDVFEKRGMDGA